MNIKSFVLVVSMLLCISYVAAQIPTLSVGNQKNSTEVYMSTLDVQVDVTGSIATTKFTMTFKNRTGKILEGELLFPLPDGVTVSHYALDINGKMRDAVPVEKAKATQVFEEIEQRRVDPGLLERVEGNNFRTRIYPIPANGTRTISIGYEQELPENKWRLAYRLPMDYKEAIDNFTLKATVWQAIEKPRMDEQPEGELKFDKQGNNFVTSFARKNYKTSQSLAFSLPVLSDIPQVVMQSASGSYYFLASCTPKSESRRKEWNNQLGIIWDASLSGLQRDIPRELDLLDAVIREKKDLTISLYLLNNRLTSVGTFAVKNGNWDILRAALEKVDYDGGTNYQAVDVKNLPSKEFLFFSDGLSTLSDGMPLPPAAQVHTYLRKVGSGKPVHCIVSSPRADYSALKWIAAQTNGKFINLNTLSENEAHVALMTETLHFLGIRTGNNVTEVYPSVATPVQGNFSVAGIMDGSKAEITMLFGYGNSIETEKTVTLDARFVASQGNIHRVWAQKKINELDMCYEKNKEELTGLGEQFGIVTRNTSLIVLETIQDYITYRITPPAELLVQYNQWAKGQEDQLRQQQQSLLVSAKSSIADLKKWWDTDFKPVKPKYPKPDNEASPTVGNLPFVPPTVTIDTEPDTNDNSSIEIVEFESISTDISEGISDADIMQEVVVTGFATQRRSSPPSGSASFMDKDQKNVGSAAAKKEKFRIDKPQPVIRMTPIKQDNEYMKKLTGKTDDDYRIYLELRPEYIGTPTFYFDIADWFFRHNDHERALLILTSIADMDLENASLFRLLGYRLKEYKAYALEAYICRKVVQWRPMEPQSYRDYALALEDAGRQQEAFNTLYSVLTQSYARNIGSRSAGIEEVVVTELNRMMANHKLDVSAIDKELIKDMPVDIRVVINWNMNSTDIDLHVTDPNNETCSYSHKRTAIGGRISRDITQGYGPEQFMLKNAVKGKYQVFVNYFGDSQVKAEGPSTIMVEVYTNYASGEQQRQVACLQMSKENRPKNNGLIKVAEFEF